MDRRRFVAAATTGALIASLARVAAQQPQRIATIGFLGPTAATEMERRIGALRAGLRDYGYVEGTNLPIEFRWADEKYERLPALAAELVSHNVDVIVTGGAAGVRAAKSATTTIPIVIAATGDAVGSGLVTSLARPGGNVTGSTYFIQDLYAKRLELLKEAIPRAVSVGVLVNPDNRVYEANIRKMEQAAKAMNVTLRLFGARGPAEIRRSTCRNGGNASGRGRRARGPDAQCQRPSNRGAGLQAPTSVGRVHRIRRCRRNDRLRSEYIELYRRAAYFVDKILKGASPATFRSNRRLVSSS